MTQSKGFIWVVVDLITASLHPTPVVLPQCARSFARDSSCFLTHGVHCLISHVHTSLAQNKAPHLPARALEEMPIVHSYFAGKARTLQVNPFEQPFRLSYLYIQSAHSSLSVHLAHWVIVVCLFFTSSCEFLEGGDHLLTWFFHLINNHLYRPMALCITQHSHAEDPFQLLSM